MRNEKKGPMTPEQVENYRRAVVPVQESLAAAKSARQEIFRSLRSRMIPPELCGVAGGGLK